MQENLCVKFNAVRIGDHLQPDFQYALSSSLFFLLLSKQTRERLIRSKDRFWERQHYEKNLEYESSERGVEVDKQLALNIPQGKVLITIWTSRKTDE